MTVQPGQSLSINCKVSYSVTSYGTAWIRQPAGKALEWIGYINGGGSTYYSNKLKNKFSISRDTATNTITLGDRICKLKTQLCIQWHRIVDSPYKNFETC
ncbi:hypothetical protein AMELA_G00020670 [Ameiurus melas]|uniref:Immunoglobulin V-set domain-containing protein n=1 Tax=Ameiurus melas TaxID=219545 RepID=A0A7J6BE74_AMEME|nr:hypothetical protein AMELA_G00020670 [Ameiurus melas]